MTPDNIVFLSLFLRGGTPQPPLPHPMLPTLLWSSHRVVDVALQVHPCVTLGLPLQHVWPWLYDDAEDRALFSALQSQMKFMKKFIEDGGAALHHLESELVSAACTDPSEEVEKLLVLPLIRARVTAAAEAHNRAQAENQSANRVRLLAHCMQSITVANRARTLAHCMRQGRGMLVPCMLMMLLVL